MRSYLKAMSIPFFMLSMMISGAALLGGCNTTEGFGDDVESVGDEFEDATD